MTSMARETLGGWSMIAGAISGLVTMAFHPTGGEAPMMALLTHSLALAGVSVSFYGAWVLTRHLATRGPMSELALAFYAASAVAAMMAATASGLVGPDLFARAAGAGADELAVVQGLLRYNHAVNQAFAKILVAASSAAIGLWSIEILRTGQMRQATGILGCIVAGITLAVLFAGRLTLDVHGFGAVVLGQAVWLILAGLELRGVGGAKRRAAMRAQSP